MATVNGVSEDTGTYLDALERIASVAKYEHPVFAPLTEAVGLRWLERASWHLTNRLDRQFRDRVFPTSEQAALALMKDIAGELLSAAHALDMAAETLKGQTGCGRQAGLVHQAAQRARAAAEGLVGT